MKWTVMAFNIITVILLATILYFQYSELTYYRAFDQNALQSYLDSQKLEKEAKDAEAKAAKEADDADRVARASEGLKDTEESTEEETTTSETDDSTSADDDTSIPEFESDDDF